MKNTIGKHFIAIALLLAGSKISAMDGQYDLKKTLEGKLVLAVSKNDISKVKEFIVQGAKLNAYDEIGNTPLGMAAEEGFKEIVALLLDKGADINFPDRTTHVTPLLGASERGKVEVVKLLLVQGADQSIPDTEKQTPLDMAKNAEIKKVLQAFQITPEDVKHIIPGVIAIRKQAGRDVSKIIASKLVQSVVDEKLKKVKPLMKGYSDAQLRKAITQNVLRALKRQGAL